MYKIAIVDKMHEDGINLLKKNPNFKCEVIEDLSKNNLISKIGNLENQINDIDNMDMRTTEIFLEGAINLLTEVVKEK